MENIPSIPGTLSFIMDIMKPDKTISSIPDWVTAPETQRVMQALNGEHSGQESQALFVGGCVRNHLLKREVEDIDIASKLNPDEVSRKLKSANVKVIPTGIDHGTVTAVTGGRNFEITTLRKDVKTDGRRAVVAFSGSWKEDAQRRDFTMNTLLMDEQGGVYDPLGNGIHDLEAARVIFVGDPETRIREDVLRILRFFRFHALYGVGQPDPSALAACAALADKIPTLSRERITQEFFKIMSVDNPVNILKLMFDNSILRGFSKFNSSGVSLEHLCEFQKRYGLISLPSRLLTLAGLAMDNIHAMQSLILFPKVFLKDMQAVLGVLALPDLEEGHATQVALYKFGRTATAQALMIELAQDRVMNGKAPQILKLIQNWEIPHFPVTGEDLIKQGYKPGPDLGKKLSELEEEWIVGGFSTEKTRKP